MSVESAVILLTISFRMCDINGYFFTDQIIVLKVCITAEMTVTRVDWCSFKGMNHFSLRMCNFGLNL